MGFEAILACCVYLCGFTAPYYTLKLGCLRLISQSFLDEFTLYLFFILLIHVFTEALHKSLPHIFFNLQNYRSFYGRIYLLSSLIFVVTAAFQNYSFLFI